MDPHEDPAPTGRPPRLLDQARDKLRTLHYSYRTEQQYLQWVRRFILFHDKRHPRTMGAPRWGRCGCVARDRASRDAPRDRNVIHRSRDVSEPRGPRFVVLVPAHSKMKRPARGGPIHFWLGD